MSNIFIQINIFVQWYLVLYFLLINWQFFCLKPFCLKPLLIKLCIENFVSCPRKLSKYVGFIFSEIFRTIHGNLWVHVYSYVVKFLRIYYRMCISEMKQINLLIIWVLHGILFSKCNFVFGIALISIISFINLLNE